MTTQDKLKAIRELMKQYKLSAYIIPPTDPHQSEYIPAHWKTREWFSGFTGSAGTVVVTEHFAGLWTDSRYFIQAEKELAGSGITLVKLKIPHTPEYIDWLCENLDKGSCVGFDGNVFSESLANILKARFSVKGIDIESRFDLPALIWKDRPEMSKEMVYEHEPRYAGKDRKEKLKLVFEQMKADGFDYHLLTALDDIAWLFNLRGNDIDYNPVFIAYALLSQSKATLFINKEKITDGLLKQLQGDGIEILPYTAIGESLASLENQKSILYTSSKISCSLSGQIPTAIRKSDGLSIPSKLKACKDAVETANIHQAMIKDGIALTRFFIWLENHLGKQNISEVDVDEKLTSFRKQQQGFVGNSFGTIAGYLDHGAIVHYSATSESAYQLKSEGLLLLDSGGQYLEGTTDITRTISLGKPTKDEKEDYTRVLKGTIRLAMAVFPEGTKGFQLDALARFALWEAHKNYGHGTGHGVGYFLNVHEGPQGITPNPAVNYPLLEGMVQSDEPGFYREGMYGIRLENLIQVVRVGQSDYGTFLAFNTLTLCPFDKNLIDKDLLSKEERTWLNTYHQKVFEKLSPSLDTNEKAWLKEKTMPL